MGNCSSSNAVTPAADVSEIAALKAEVAALKDALQKAMSMRTTHRSEQHISNYAVSIHWLVNVFLKEHPDIRSKALTTIAVTNDIIKAAVQDRGCRYVDLIDSAFVSKGKSLYFISHVWGRPFIELVDQIIEHFKPENQAIWRPKGSKNLQWDEIYVWLDVFAINQNDGTSKVDDLDQLKEVVEDCEETLMILDKEGSVLTRIWCLFEAWHSGKKGKDALRLLTYNVNLNELEKVFIELDVSKAKASVDVDRDRILAAIASDVGVHEMTHQLKDALVNSVTSSIPPDGVDHPWTLKLSKELQKAGSICQLYAKYSEAEVLLRRDLRGHEFALSPDHASTLTAMSNLAELLYHQGKLPESASLFKSVMEGRSKVLGPDHQDTLGSTNNLAVLLRDQGKLAEAEVLYRGLLVSSSKTLGPDHPDSLASMNNLALLLQDQGKLAEAEPLYRHALEVRIKVLDPDHPHILVSMNCLASLLQEQGKLAEAEPLYRHALEVRTKVLGSEHPVTLNSMVCIASLLQDQGKLSEAELLYCSALESRTTVLGPYHPDTLSSSSLLGDLYRLQGKFDEAELLQRQSLEGREKVLGAGHSSTLISAHRLASLYVDKGIFDAARTLCVRALEGREKTLGLDHKETVESIELMKRLEMKEKDRD